MKDGRAIAPCRESGEVTRAGKQRRPKTVRTPRIFATAAVLTLATMLWATSAFAQSQPLRANIPFDFYVAGKLLPAGAYTIATIGQGSAIQLWDRNGNSIFAMARDHKPDHSTGSNRLVFHRYGTTNFLSGIYWEGFTSGRELAPS